jgi:hypothetical protein
VVSTAQVQIRPDHGASSWRPVIWRLPASRRRCRPRPGNAYLVHHDDGPVLSGTGQDRASVTDPAHFPGGMTRVPHDRLARFEISPQETPSAGLDRPGCAIGDVRTAVISQLQQDHIGGFAELSQAGTVSQTLLALGALAVSYAAIATLVRDRGWVVATVAALIGGIGAFCGAMFNVLVGVNLAAAATAHLSQNAAARFLVTTFNSGFGHVFMDVYFIGIFAAPVLMGFALWRSRSVPRWLAVLFLIGLEVAQQVSSAGPVLVVLFMLPFAVAMVLLAARIWQAAALPASHNPEPAGVPA